MCTVVVMWLAGTVADKAAIELAASLREAELVDTAERLERALGSESTGAALETWAPRSVVEAALRAALRGVVLRRTLPLSGSQRLHLGAESGSLLLCCDVLCRFRARLDPVSESCHGVHAHSSRLSDRNVKLSGSGALIGAPAGLADEFAAFLLEQALRATLRYDPAVSGEGESQDDD